MKRNGDRSLLGKAHVSVTSAGSSLGWVMLSAAAVVGESFALGAGGPSLARPPARNQEVTRGCVARGPPRDQIPNA